MAQYTGKGSQIGIEGTIQTDSYDGQDGKRVFTTDVIVNNFDFLDSKPKQQQPQQNQQHQTYEQAGADISDQVLPF